MPKTTHIIAVTQGVYGHVIDEFTIDIDNDLGVYEQDQLINQEMHRRIKKGETNGKNT